MEIQQKIQILKLRDSNVNHLQIEYSGGGDDGMIDEIDAFDKEGNLLENATSLINDSLYEYFYYKLNDAIEYDWINNAGGSGIATFYLENNKFIITHDQMISQNVEYNLELEDVPSIIA